MAKKINVETGRGKHIAPLGGTEESPEQQPPIFSLRYIDAD